MANKTWQAPFTCNRYSTSYISPALLLMPLLESVTVGFCYCHWYCHYYCNCHCYCYCHCQATNKLLIDSTSTVLSDNKVRTHFLCCVRTHLLSRTFFLPWNICIVLSGISSSIREVSISSCLLPSLMASLLCSFLCPSLCLFLCLFLFPLSPLSRADYSPIERVCDRCHGRRSAPERGRGRTLELSQTRAETGGRQV